MADRNNTQPIATERLTAGGQTGPDAMDWALRAGLGLLVLSAVWFVVVLIKPLPAGHGQAPPSIPALVAIPSHAAPIEVRQQRLAALDEGGNIFAADRMNWPIEIVRSDEPSPTLELTSGRGAQSAAIPVATGGQGIDSIELAENVSVAIRKRLEQLKLRGVFAIGDQKSAMIGQKSNFASEIYREGDTFDDGEWRVVAIDVEQDRVILNRSGQNFELKLYDVGMTALVKPRATISATNANGDVVIDFSTLDKVEAELRESGLPRDQINDLIALSQGDQITDATPEAAEAEPDAETKKVAIPPAMPPHMVQLFKAMAEGSRDVVTPAPKSAQDTDDASEADDTDTEESGDDSND